MLWFLLDTTNTIIRVGSNLYYSKDYLQRAENIYNLGIAIMIAIFTMLTAYSAFSYWVVPRKIKRTLKASLKKQKELQKQLDELTKSQNNAQTISYSVTDRLAASEKQLEQLVADIPKLALNQLSTKLELYGKELRRTNASLISFSGKHSLIVITLKDATNALRSCQEAIVDSTVTADEIRSLLDKYSIGIFVDSYVTYLHEVLGSDFIASETSSTSFVCLFLEDVRSFLSTSSSLLMDLDKTGPLLDTVDAILKRLQTPTS